MPPLLCYDAAFAAAAIRRDAAALFPRF